MKVDFTSNAGFYPGKKLAGAGREDTKAPAARKTDVAEFSRGSCAALDKTLLNAKAAIQSGVSAGVSAARLEELKQSIKSGTYQVHSIDIADAILGSE